MNLKFVAIGTLAFSAISVFPADFVRASPLDIEFEVKIDSGRLLGENFDGHFVYENSEVSSSGLETADLLEFSFAFDNRLFSLPDALNPSPEAEFLDGDLTGVFFATEEFSFEIDFFGQQLFAYFDSPSNSLSSGGDGFGDVTFRASDDSPPVTVSENSSAFAFGVFPLLMGAAKLRKKVLKLTE